MKQISAFHKMSIAMLLFGLLMGFLFPFYANFFVLWKPEVKGWFLLGSLGAGAIVGVSNYLIVQFTIKKLIISLLQTLNQLTGDTGDLTQRVDVKSSDEIGEIANNFNTFLENIEIIVSQIRKKDEELNISTEHIVTEIKEISKTSQNLRNSFDSQTERANNSIKELQNISTSNTLIYKDMGVISNAVEFTHNSIYNIKEKHTHNGELVAQLKELIHESHDLIRSQLLAPEDQKMIHLICNKIKKEIDLLTDSHKDITTVLQATYETSLTFQEIIEKSTIEITDITLSSANATDDLERVNHQLQRSNKEVKELDNTIMRIESEIETLFELSKNLKTVMSQFKTE